MTEGEKLVVLSEAKAKALARTQQRVDRSLYNPVGPNQIPAQVALMDTVVVRFTSVTINANGYYPAVMELYSDATKTWTEPAACWAFFQTGDVPLEITSNHWGKIVDQLPADGAMIVAVVQTWPICAQAVTGVVTGSAGVTATQHLGNGIKEFYGVGFATGNVNISWVFYQGNTNFLPLMANYTDNPSGPPTGNLGVNDCWTYGTYKTVAASTTYSGATANTTAGLNFVNGIYIGGSFTGVTTVNGSGGAVTVIASITGPSIITWSGTTAITGVLTNQNANLVLAGPTSGGAAAPTFRALVAADIPAGGGSPLTTKGDLYTFSSVNARLPVGTDTYYLVADGSQTTGLRWVAPGTGVYYQTVGYVSGAAQTQEPRLNFDPDAFALTDVGGASTNVALVTSGIKVTVGGTGTNTFTPYAVICGGTTATGALQSIASVGTTGQVLTSNGAGALPTFKSAGGSGGGGTPGNSPTWIKTTLTNASFATSGVYITIYTLTASQMILAGFFKLATNFTGGSVTTATLACGDTASNTGFMVALNVHSGATTYTVFSGGITLPLYGFQTTGSDGIIKAALSTGGDTVAHLTQGTVEVWMLIGDAS